MNHFKFLGHLDTFAVTAALHKRRAGNRADFLLRDEDGVTLPDLEGWVSMHRLLAKVCAAANLPENYGEVTLDFLYPGITPFECAVNPQYLTFIVPLVTNPYAREYARDEMVHAPVGALLWANAGVHRASANWGELPRYHLNVQIKEAVK